MGRLMSTIPSFLLLQGKMRLVRWWAPALRLDRKKVRHPTKRMPLSAWPSGVLLKWGSLGGGV